MTTGLRKAFYIFTTVNYNPNTKIKKYTTLVNGYVFVDNG